LSGRAADLLANRGDVAGVLRRRKLTDADWAWGISRVLCWAVGLAAILAVGASAGPHDPLGITTPFGDLGDKLVGPFARWDTAWYVAIADHGYATAQATRFYPLYPLAAKVVGLPFGSSLIGGILVSLGSLLVALKLMVRLARLELGEKLAVRSMLLLAFFPTAIFFSAAYTEALFVALSIGAFYAARRGRWALAGLVGGLATLSRPTALVLIVPLVLLYFYGPRDDRPGPAESARGLRPRYGFRPDALWLLLVPCGILAYAAYLGAKFNDPLMMLGQGKAWHQTFTFPLVTVWRSAQVAADGAANVFHGQAPNDIYEFGFFCFAVIATIGAFRRLPFAYGAYCAAGVLFIISFPIRGESLASFSRYMAPLFPILMWLAVWSSERRLFRPVLVLFALAMVVNSARFATWHWVG
jgi:hypothetical protein